MCLISCDVGVYIFDLFMHLSDAFIQSDLQLHSGYTFFYQHVCSL